MMNFYKLYQGDCFDIDIDSKFDLILTDPPYNLISSKWDKKIDWFKLGKKFINNLKESGTLIIFGKQPMLVDVYNSFKEYFDFRFEYIWEKQNMIWVSDYQPLPVHENIWVFSNKKLDEVKEKLNLKK